MKNIKSFKDLKVWQKAHELALDTIELLDSFPNRLGLRSVAEQLLRSVTSIGANIAEGYGSFSRKEYRRYLGIALKSSYEVENWLKLIRDSKVISRGLTKEKISALQKGNVEVIKMLVGLMKKLET